MATTSVVFFPLITLLAMAICSCPATTAAAGASPPPHPPPSTQPEAQPTCTSPEQAQPAGAAVNCTPPRTLEDTQRPFCFVPETASSQARQFLSQAAAGPGAALYGDYTKDKAKLAALREFLQNFSISNSQAAEQAFLESTRNDTIAGIHVVFAAPKGVKSSTSQDDAKLLIYVHGGGYVVGSCHMQWNTVAPTAAAAGLPILCIEYRLAPEHPFPAALNDLLAVYKALLQQRGYHPRNMALLGDSAGGGLVAALALLLAREALPLPAALGMFSPWVELQTPLDTTKTLIGVDPLLANIAADAGSAHAYVGGDAALFADPLVCPLRGDYTGVFAGGRGPNVLIQVGLRELLLSEAVLLYHKMKGAAAAAAISAAAAAAESGAPARGALGRATVAISPYDAVWHVFQMAHDLPEAQAAAREMGEFFAASLGGAAAGAT